MYNPISNDFFDQIQVAIQRKIPSTVVYFENNEKKIVKDLVKSMSVDVGIEYLIMKSNLRIRLEYVSSFNGRVHKDEKLF
ncbi:MAG: transcriptional antiterminator Rof [Campylobacterota bacterium]|nr:transcriptional antiterminator Rof [Campylobacterota bacterium]